MKILRLMFVLGAIAGAPVPAQAATVDWQPLVFTQLSFSSGGLTVTGTHNGAAANVSSSLGRGVGVVGGFNNFTVDRSDPGLIQTLTYTFDSGAAANIVTNGGASVSPFNFDVEAFAPGGSSLGTINLTTAGAPISIFLAINLLNPSQL